VVQAVGLGVEAERAAPGQVVDEIVELVSGANPSGRGTIHAPP
jgi:hypothetical protein